MKHFLFFALITIFLTACNSTQPAPTVSPAMTLETSTYLTPDTPTPDTQAPTPSTTLGASPEATVPPTEPRDPNMPPGATGKDAQGYYMDVQENGKPVRYRDVTLTDSNGKEVYRAWVTDRVINGDLNGGMSLIQHDDDINMSNLVPRYVYLQNGSKGPYFSHPDHPGISIPVNVTDVWFSVLYNSRFKSSTYSRFDFYNAIQDGTLSVSTTTPNGDTIVWKPSKTVGYKSYITSFESLDPAKNTKLHIWETWDYAKKDKLIYRWTVFTDQSGNLVSLVAVEHPEGLSDDEWRILILGPLAQVSAEKILESKIYYFSASEIMTSAGRGPGSDPSQYPDLKIVPNP